MASIYGGAFADENFTLKHSTPGLLSMVGMITYLHHAHPCMQANSGPGTNGCQVGDSMMDGLAFAHSLPVLHNDSQV